jgi:hypothetical protein
MSVNGIDKTMNSTYRSQILKETLVAWEDADLAAYKLACALGILPPEDGTYSGFREHKSIFWGANPLGESLGRFLDDLVRNSVLQYDEDAMMFRWNKDFKAA